MGQTFLWKNARPRASTKAEWAQDRILRACGNSESPENRRMQHVESQWDSQWDSVTQPRVATKELPWVGEANISNNAEGVAASCERESIGRNSFRVDVHLLFFTGSSFVATLGWSMKSLRDMH
jgi:hypothetical protein